MDLKAEMNAELEAEVVQRHSYFQLKYLLVGKEPTNQSRMWKCLEEMKGRREALDALELECEESKDQVELLEIQLARAKQMPVTSDLDTKEKEIRKRQIARKIVQAEANLTTLAKRRKSIEEESRFFLENFRAMKKDEELKPFDDVESQKKYWNARIAQKINVSMLSSNTLNADLIETVLALPDDMIIKQQALGLLNIRHAHLVQTMKETAGKLEGTSK